MHMKKIITIGKIVFWGLVLCLGNTNCSNDYLEDGGTHNPYYEGTVWDYLNSRPDCFSELVQIIRFCDMEDVFKDSTITFFAPHDLSIRNTMNYVNRIRYIYEGKDSVTDFRQIKPQIWKEYLQQYIIPGKYLLKDVNQMDTTNMAAYGGQAYISYSGRPMNMGVVYHDEKGVKYAGYRQLLYSYVFSYVDYEMMNAYVATSDIQPLNGVVHAIRFSGHAFGFYVYDFYSKADAAGILSISEVTNE